mgnify:CR=1 FL=1
MIVPKVGKSIHCFLSAYTVERLAVVNFSLKQQIEINDCPVDFITPSELSDWIELMLR